MQVSKFAISEVLLVLPRRLPDVRGFFSEVYNAASYHDIGITDVFVQDNISFSSSAGTIRGLHFQKPPYAQAKLVRVSRGRILDIALDLRTQSPTYLMHVAAELSSESGVQIYIPQGFAHGFCTLEPDTEVAYKVSKSYAPSAEGGILWSDPKLKIAWPVGEHDAVISEKDALLPRLEDLPSIF